MEGAQKVPSRVPEPPPPLLIFIASKFYSRCHLRVMQRWKSHRLYATPGSVAYGDSYSGVLLLPGSELVVFHQHLLLNADRPPLAAN